MYHPILIIASVCVRRSGAESRRNRESAVRSCGCYSCGVVFADEQDWVVDEAGEVVGEDVDEGEVDVYILGGIISSCYSSLGGRGRGEGGAHLPIWKCLVVIENRVAMLNSSSYYDLCPYQTYLSV